MVKEEGYQGNTSPHTFVVGVLWVIKWIVLVQFCDLFMSTGWPDHTLAIVF